VPQPHPQVDAEVHLNPGPPGQPDGLGEPPAGRPGPIGDAEALGDQGLVVAGPARRRPAAGRGVARVHREVEYLFLLAPVQRQDPVRRQPGEGLLELEVVGELGHGLLHAVPDPGHQPAPCPHPLAQHADQVRVLGEPLGQDRLRSGQRRGAVGDTKPRVGERDGAGRRIGGRIAEQQVGQRFQAGLASYLRPGPALGLVGEVDVFQARLRIGGHDLVGQRIVELALGADRLEDGAAALLELAQVAQPFLERTQLRVVQRPGRLLAVAGDERHRRAAVEQLDRRRDLSFADAKLAGDPLPQPNLAGRRC